MNDLSVTRNTDNNRASDFLGHPRALIFLFSTEMWERFSYYGMRSLLVLYMIGDLLKPEKAEKVWGLGSLRHGLEAIFGRLSDQGFASQIYGFYTGFIYLTPILGGLLADRLIGRSATVLLGAGLMVAGHFMMASDRLFLVALFLLIVGGGTFKPNVTTQVGEIYAPGDPRVDRAYSIFYVGINIGAFFSPLVCGYLGERIAWHYGFISAGVGMAVAMAVYVVGLPSLPKISRPRRTPIKASADAGRARASFVSLLLLFIPSALFWAAYEQQGNTIAVWIHDSIDRHADLLVWHGEIPVTWFQAANPILIFLLTPPLVAIWSYLGRRGQEPSTVAKMITGFVLLGLAYVILAAVAWSSGSQSVSWLWLLLYFAVLTVAELHFSPIGLSLMSSIAPDHARSSLIAVWFTSIFVGNFLAGTLGGFWSHFSAPVFFMVVAGLGGVAALITLGVWPFLNRMLSRAGRQL
ncbi:MAG: peptide MFS transporter [Xanthobacteraceae bacterium]|nr:peptide MFS transporter [Xanthobacteraceae bacterium]